MSEEEAELSFFNSEKYSCEFSTCTTFEPLYIQHPLKIGHCSLSLKLERVAAESRLPLFMSEWLPFVKNLAAMLLDPTQLGEAWEELQEQITFYVYVYRLLQR